MISAQPRIKTHGDYGRQPQCVPEPRIAERDSGHARSFSLSRLPQSWGDADIAGERTAIAKPRQIAELANQAGRGLCADASNRSEQFADLVRIKLPLDLILDLIQSAALQLDVFASVSHLQPVGLGVMLSHRVLGRLDHPAREAGAHLVATVVTQGSEFAHRHGSQLTSGWITGKDCSRQPTLEPAHVTSELGKAQV